MGRGLLKCLISRSQATKFAMAIDLASPRKAILRTVESSYEVCHGKCPSVFVWEYHEVVGWHETHGLAVAAMSIKFSSRESLSDCACERDSPVRGASPMYEDIRAPSPCSLA